MNPYYEPANELEEPTNELEGVPPPNTYPIEMEEDMEAGGVPIDPSLYGTPSRSGFGEIQREQEDEEPDPLDQIVPGPSLPMPVPAQLRYSPLLPQPHPEPAAPEAAYQFQAQNQPEPTRLRGVPFLSRPSARPSGSHSHAPTPRMPAMSPVSLDPVLQGLGHQVEGRAGQTMDQFVEEDLVPFLNLQQGTTGPSLDTMTHITRTRDMLGLMVSLLYSILLS